MRKFQLYDDWYCEGEGSLFEKKEIELKEGLTVLVGCNGAGKTTLISQIKDRLHEQGIRYISYNNLAEGGSTAMENALAVQNFAFLSTAALSSEGENIVMNLGNFAAKIKKKVLKVEESDDKELWVFMDAVDSGLSIDNVVELKKLLHTVIEDCHDRNVAVYIIVSANSYEVARMEHCFNVISGEYVGLFGGSFGYENYRKLILDTAEKKRKRG